MRTTPFASLKSLFAVSDEQLMWRVRTQDDPEAFAQLVKRWEKPIQRLAARMTGDPHRSEDLAQETFARLFARRKNYRPVGKLSTFLWRIALNLCYDELRRIKRRGESSLDGPDTDGVAILETLAAGEAAPDTCLAANERAQHVRQALLRLPEPYRAVLVLRHYENLKFREIGEVLGVPEGTVKSRMAEALSLLSRLLSHLTDDTQPKQPRQPMNESLVL
jgi:RNA polymerase sigma-70 factor (ECF subfamily)